MVRVLHLLNHDAHFEAQRGAEGLLRALGEGFTVETHTIGRGGGFRDVAHAATMLRRERRSHDLVHAWGGPALTAATLGTQRRIVFSPDVQTRSRMIGWLRAIMAYRDVQVVCPTATLRRRLVERGVELERCHLIRPGVEFARIQRRRNAVLRAKLGFAEGDHVILAPGESTRSAGHEQALAASTVLHVAEPRYRLLLWGRGPGTERVRHFASRLGGLTAVHFAEQQLSRPIEFEDLLPAVDSVLLPAVGPVATLPIAICMAAALPIVSHTSYTVGELLEDRHNALMVGTTNPRQMAQRILDLTADTNLQWKISDMARTEAYEYFAFTRFVNQFRGMYRQVAAGEKVAVAEEAPGAGLRFHGRA